MTYRVFAAIGVALLMVSGLSCGPTASAAPTAELLPFESFRVKGTVERLPDNQGGDFQLAFDTHFRLDPTAEIPASPDVQIDTMLAFPSASGQIELSDVLSPFVQMKLSVQVAGECFDGRGGNTTFELPVDRKQRDSCVSSSVQLLESSGESILRLPLNQILNGLSVQLVAPRGRRGQWLMKSSASFGDPGFPFPVAGFGGFSMVSGTALTVGDSTGFAAFDRVQFTGGS